MSTLSQFTGGGGGVPVGSFVNSFSLGSPNIIDTGTQVFAKAGTAQVGASASTISKVQASVMPGFAVPANCSTLGYSQANSYPAGNSLAYGNSIWLRSSSESMLKSSDGVNWKPVSYFVSASTQSTYISSRIIFFNSAFFVTIMDSNLSGYIITSTDGENWSTIKTVSTTTSFGVTPVSATFTLNVANGILFAVLSYSSSTVATQIYSSTDGVTWKMGQSTTGALSMSAGTEATEVAFGAGVYIIGNNSSSQGARSSDGINWVAQSMAITGIYSIKFLNSLFVAVGTSGQIATSTNGTTWTSRTSNVASSLHDIEFGASIFVAVGESGVITTSPDGTTWTSRTSGLSQTIGRIIFANSLFVAIGTQGATAIITSSNGTTWTSQTIPYTDAFQGVANSYTVSNNPIMYDGAASPKWWYISGPGRAIASSANATSWTRVLDTTAAQGQAGSYVAFNYLNGKFILCPTTGGIQTCDPTTQLWSRTLDVTTVFYGIEYMAGTYVAVGQSGATYTSSDAITWTSRSNGAANLIAIISAGGLFYALTNGAVVRTSPDGITWTARGTASGQTGQLAYSNGILVAISGIGNQVYRSTDGGTTWNSFNIDNAGNTYYKVKVVNGVFFFLSSVGAMTFVASIDILGTATAISTGGSAQPTDVIYSPAGFYIVYAADGFTTSIPASQIGRPSPTTTSAGVANSLANQQNYIGQVGNVSSQGPGLVAAGPAGEMIGIGSVVQGTTSVYSMPDGGMMGVTGIFNQNFQGGNYDRLFVGSSYVYFTRSGNVCYAQRTGLTSACLAEFTLNGGAAGGTSSTSTNSVHRRIA